ncbi:MAG: flagellar protein FlaG [Burkholderiaceae bacterium]|nr:flagellar protein FlaG [Burkholderiaceae bacterium]
MDIRPVASISQSGVPAPTPQASTNSSSGSAATVTVDKSSTVAQASGAQSEPSIAQVSQAVQKINKAMESQAQGIEFSMDSSSHRIVVKIVDQQNNQVIRQIPSKEALAIADSLDQTQGLLIKQQV